MYEFPYIDVNFVQDSLYKCRVIELWLYLCCISWFFSSSTEFFCISIKIIASSYCRKTVNCQSLNFLHHFL